MLPEQPQSILLSILVVRREKNSLTIIRWSPHRDEKHSPPFQTQVPRSAVETLKYHGTTSDDSNIIQKNNAIF